MIDVHCHLLPGIDDGPSNVVEALKLCRLMVANGITHAVATPHIHLGRWDNTEQSIGTAYDTLRTAISDEKIPLQLGMAAEVRIDAEILPLLAMQKIPMLGRWLLDGVDYQVMLLELPHNQVPPGSDKLIAWLKARNILAMIAHPERNKGFQRHRDKLEPFIAAGCLFQLTAASVVGGFGDAAQELADWMLDQRLATVLATDAHNEKGRRPLLAEARAQVASVYDEQYAELLVRQNPQRLVSEQFNSLNAVGQL